jgi:hypothetical protein
MNALAENDAGICDRCSRPFRYRLIHNGFNDSSYAYCDSCCYTALLDHWTAPKEIARLDYGIIPADVEQDLLPCPIHGHFRATSLPRCLHCDEPLDPVRAADYIEPNAPGTAKGWRWQRSWNGLYCIIIEGRLASDPWKPREKT